MTKIMYALMFVLSSLAGVSQEMHKTEEPNYSDTLLTNLKNNAFNPAQSEPEMADLFRSEGKIYVVIAVLAIIFLCLIAYLIYIDVRLRKLENKK